jgi:hypothetical protein
MRARVAGPDHTQRPAVGLDESCWNSGAERIPARISVCREAGSAVVLNGNPGGFLPHDVTS